MRTIFTVAALAAASVAASLSGASSVRAEITYPWCAQYSDEAGARNCGFSTWDQCRAAISGNGGFCEENSMYRAAPGSVFRETTGFVTPIPPAARRPQR